MKNSEMWDTYNDYTSSVTDSARKLGFACAGVCWFFKATDNTFPVLILWALGLDVAYFFADLSQYVAGALFTKFWTESKERQFKSVDKNIHEEDFPKPMWLDIPAFSMWIVKLFLILLAFICLVIHIFSFSAKTEPKQKGHCATCHSSTLNFHCNVTASYF